MAHNFDFERVLLLGGPATDKLQTADLSEDINFEEFKTIVWQPCNWRTQLHDSSAASVTAWVHKVERRLLALAGWLTSGNDLVVVLDRLSPIPYGRGNIFDFRTVVPLNAVKFQNVTGERVKFSGPVGLSEFSNQWLDVLCYRHVISGEKLSPLFTVSAATMRSIQVVSGVIHTKGEGNLILVPPDNSDPRSIARANYLIALAALPALLRQGGSDLPNWVEIFKSQNTIEAEAAIQKLTRQIADASARIAAHKAEIQKDDWLRELYAGSGESFTNAVASALTELGLKVVEGPNSRADLIFTDGLRLATAEVKGLEGSIREQNFRQAERWVTEVNHALVSTAAERRNDVDLHRYHEKLEQIGISKGESDLECKGLMIVGTFRKTPIDLRTAPDYPDQLARPLGRSRICSMTGLQFFNALMSIRNDPALREPFIDAIFETNGSFQSSLTWTQFLSLSPQGT
jgi:hypothetical protein